MNKTLFYKISIFFSLLSINLIIYIADLISVDRSLVTVLLSFTCSTVLLVIYLFTEENIVQLPIRARYFILFVIFSILIPLAASVFLNDVIEYTATIMRLISYITFMYLIYALTIHNYIKFKDIYNVFCVLVVVCLFFGVIQILTGNLVNMNQADRLSSIYGRTPAGFALLMLLTSSFFYGCFFNRQIKVNKVILLFFFLVSMIMMVLTHSRQALFTLFLVIFFLHWLKSGSFMKIVVLIFLSAIMFLFFYIAMNTDMLPRIAILISSGLTDDSSQTRIAIIINSLEGFSGLDRFIGIGLGGFNHFYKDITGELGVAAHNDYLLFFVEGGILSFLCFIIITFYGLFYFLKRAKHLDTFYIPLSVFLSISLLSFLNNPLYYVQTQVLTFAVYGFFIAQNNHDIKVSKAR
jgi:hypothetical protein